MPDSCSFAGCPAPAEHCCDNCNGRFCGEHVRKDARYVICLACEPTPVQRQLGQGSKVQVLGKGAPVYSGPDLRADRVAFLDSWLKVDATEEVGDFFAIQSPYGLKGFVPKSAARLIGAAPPKRELPRKPESTPPPKRRPIVEEKPSEDYQYEGIWPLHWGWRAFLFASWFLLTPLIGIGVGLWRLTAGTRTTAWSRAGFLAITLLVFAASFSLIGLAIGMPLGDDGIHQSDVDAARNVGYQQGQSVGFNDGQQKGYSDGVSVGKKTLCWDVADAFVLAGNRAGPAFAAYCKSSFGSR